MRRAIAKQTRWYRKWHNWMGFTSLFVLGLVCLTGLLLIWKKNSHGYLLADSKKGSSTEFSRWLSFDSLTKAATVHMQAKYGASLPLVISRIDARPDKGMVKILYEGHYHGLQLDAATGALLTYEERRADFVEHLHDGTFIDNLMGTKGAAKLTYGSIAGGCLLFLLFSGFWLWYNPRRMKKAAH